MKGVMVKTRAQTKKDNEKRIRHNATLSAAAKHLAIMGSATRYHESEEAIERARKYWARHRLENNEVLIRKDPGSNAFVMDGSTAVPYRQVYPMATHWPSTVGWSSWMVEPYYEPNDQSRADVKSRNIKLFNSSKRQIPYHKSSKQPYIDASVRPAVLLAASARGQQRHVHAQPRRARKRTIRTR